MESLLCVPIKWNITFTSIAQWFNLNIAYSIYASGLTISCLARLEGEEIQLSSRIFSTAT